MYGPLKVKPYIYVKKPSLKSENEALKMVTMLLCKLKCTHPQCLVLILFLWVWNLASQFEGTTEIGVV